MIRCLNGGRRERVGGATSYIVGSGSTRGLAKVVRGVVTGVGIADARSVDGRAQARGLLAGL